MAEDEGAIGGVDDRPAGRDVEGIDRVGRRALLERSCCIMITKMWS